MAIFDATILNMIRAGNRTGALDALNTGQPNAFLETIGAAVEALDSNAESTSSSSVTIQSSGTKTFTLDQTRGWKAGTPVYIMETGAPKDRFIVGKLDSDETALGVITVDVFHTKGTGTFTDWVVLSLFAVTTVVSPPVAIADGGTGAADKATVRSSFELTRSFNILGVLSDPPVGASEGDQYIVGDQPTGAWITHENEIAKRSGGAWVFVTPGAGDQAYDAQSALEDQYLFIDRSQSQGGLWLNSKWLSMTDARRWTLFPFGPGSLSIDLEDMKPRTVFVATNMFADADVTIPNLGVGVGGEAAFVNPSAYAVVLRVATSGTINGRATVILGPHQSVNLVASGPNTWHSKSNSPDPWHNVEITGTTTLDPADLTTRTYVRASGLTAAASVSIPPLDDADLGQEVVLINDDDDQILTVLLTNGSPARLVSPRTFTTGSFSGYAMALNPGESVYLARIARVDATHDAWAEINAAGDARRDSYSGTYNIGNGTGKPNPFMSISLQDVGLASTFTIKCIDARPLTGTASGNLTLGIDIYSSGGSFIATMVASGTAVPIVSNGLASTLQTEIDAQTTARAWQTGDLLVAYLTENGSGNYTSFALTLTVEVQ